MKKSNNNLSLKIANDIADRNRQLCKQSLKIKEEMLNDNIALMKLEGRIDISTQNLFYSKMSDLLKLGAEKFIIECPELHNMNSLGIKSILDIMNRLGDKNSFRLINPNTRITKILKALSLDDILVSYHNIVDAVKSFRINDKKSA